MMSGKIMQLLAITAAKMMLWGNLIIQSQTPPQKCYYLNFVESTQNTGKVDLFFVFISFSKYL